jgi:hypothetical protein
MVQTASDPSDTSGAHELISDFATFSLAPQTTLTTNLSIDESTRERLLFLINNTSYQNVVVKAGEISSLLISDELLKWFSGYLVDKRVSGELNF